MHVYGYNLCMHDEQPDCGEFGVLKKSINKRSLVFIPSHSWKCDTKGRIGELHGLVA